MSRVWTLDLPRNERDVLLVLADHADDDGRGARPSIAYIAWKLGISTREVIRGLKWLRDPKRRIIEITRESGFHKPNVYRLFISRVREKEPFQPKGDKASHIQPERVTTDKSKGDKSPSQGDTISHPNHPLETYVLEPPSIDSGDKSRDAARDAAQKDFAAVFQTVESALGELTPHDCELLKDLWEDSPDLDAHHYAFLQTQKYATGFNLAYYGRCLRGYRQNGGKAKRTHLGGG